MEQLILFLGIESPPFLFPFSLFLLFHLLFILKKKKKSFSFTPLIQIESLKALDDADNIFLALSSCLLSDVPGLLEARCRSS